MKNTTRRVVILKNVNSDLIEQAILILKNSAADENSQVLREAEKIVEKYMGKKREKLREEKKPPAAVILSVGAALVSIGVLMIAFLV